MEQAHNPAASKALNDRLLVAAYVVLALALCVTTFLCWRLMGRSFIGTDDSNIGFIYARNAAAHHGIVFNVGGEKVEGFSSPLYFFIGTVFYFFSATPEKALFAFNFLLCLGSNALVLYLIHRFCDAAGLDSWRKGLFLLGYIGWIIANPGFTAWTIVSLMDSGIFTALILVTACWIGLQILHGRAPSTSEQVGFVGLMVLLTISRPEGPAWALTALACLAVVRFLQTSSLKQTVREIGPALVAVVFVQLAFTGFRLWYFGYPMVNTYYVKVSEGHAQTLHDGIAYLRGFVRFMSPLQILPWLAGLIWLAFTVRRSRLQKPWLLTFVVLAFVSVGLFVPVLEGGDHFGSFRMYQFMYPLLPLSMFLPLFFDQRKGTKPWGLIFVLLVGCGAALSLKITWPTFNRVNTCTHDCIAGRDNQLKVFLEWTLATNGRSMGTRMREMFAPAPPTVAIIAAGGFPYSYQGTVYDMVGLNFARMSHADTIKSGPKGHQGFNKSVFYAVAPQVLLPECPATAPSQSSLQQEKVSLLGPHDFTNQVMKNIFSDSEFNQLYVYASLTEAHNQDAECHGYFLRSYLQSLPEGHFAVKTFD